MSEAKKRARAAANGHEPENLQEASGPIGIIRHSNETGKSTAAQRAAESLSRRLKGEPGDIGKLTGKEFQPGEPLYPLGVAAQRFGSERNPEKIKALWQAVIDEFSDDPAALKILREVDSAAGLVDLPPEFGGPKPPLSLPTLADLQGVIAQTRYLWNGYIMAGGITLIGAAPGAGKTCFHADLHRRWWHGLTWPDGTPIEATEEERRRPVLYLMSDRRPTQISETYAAMDVPADSVILLAEPDKPAVPTLLDDAGAFDMIERAVEQYRPSWICIDTLTSALGGIDSMDPKKLNGPLGRLLDIAVSFDIPIIALAHLSASGHVHGRQVEKYSEHFLTLTLSDPSDARSPRNLKVKRSRRIEKTDDLGVHFSQAGWEYGPPHEEAETGAKSPRGSKGEMDSAAVALILDRAGKAGATQKELADALAGSDRDSEAAKKAAQRALERLRDSESAVNVRGRWYKAGNQPHDVSSESASQPF